MRQATPGRVYVLTSQDKWNYGAWNGRAPMRSGIRQSHFLNIQIFALHNQVLMSARFLLPFKLYLLTSVYQSNQRQTKPVASGTITVRVLATNQIKKPSTLATNIVSAPKITQCCSARKGEILSHPQIRRDYMILIYTQFTTPRTRTDLRFILPRLLLQ